MGIEENISKLRPRGLIPSMTKGKPRWRVTYSSGEQKDDLRTPDAVKKAVRKGDIVKVEKMRVLIILRPGGRTKNDLMERPNSSWRDVSEHYLLTET